MLRIQHLALMSIKDDVTDVIRRSPGSTRMRLEQRAIRDPTWPSAL